PRSGQHRAHEEDRERDREGGEERAQGVAEEVLPDQAGVGHGASPVPFTSTPLSRRITWSTKRSARGSCVTMTTVFSKARFNSPSRVRISTADFASRAPVGPAGTIRAGSATMAV